MLKKIYFTALLCLLSNHATAGGKKPMFSILSWNILGPSTQDVDQFFPGTQGNYARLEQIINHIKSHNAGHGGASIIALQEVDGEARKKLSHELKKAGYTEIGYQEKGKNGGTVLYAKTNEFDFMNNINMPLAGSDQKFPGAAAAGLLQSKKTGERLIVASVHVSRGNDSRPENVNNGNAQLVQLRDALQQSFGPLPMIITGDFNTHSDEIQSTTIPQVFNRAFQDVFPGTTTSSNSDGSKQGSIDHMLFNGLMQPSHIPPQLGAPDTARLIHHQLPSDHRSLYAVFELPLAGQAQAAIAKAMPAPLPKTFVPETAKAMPTLQTQVKKLTYEEIQKHAASLRENLGYELILEQAVIDEEFRLLFDFLVKEAQEALAQQKQSKKLQKP